MKKGVRALLLPIFMFLSTQHAAASDRVLVVVSSYGTPDGKTRPGFEFDEFAQSWLVFKENGITMDVASPRGGRAWPGKYNKSKPYNEATLRDSSAMQALRSTLPTSAVKASDYKAIVLIGGKGAMFDLPFDPALQDLITAFDKNNACIAAVCHAPAALAMVKKADGTPLLKDKKTTSFTNDEERYFGKEWVKEFPFLAEDRIKHAGGTFERAEVMLPKVVADGNIVTGQNPFSAALFAEKVVVSLGKKPAKRTLWPDERSMLAVQRAWQGQWDSVKAVLAAESPSFDLELIAVYGYYRLMFEPKDPVVLRNALNVIEMVLPYYYAEPLVLEQASGYVKLGNKEKARQILLDLRKKEPNSEDVKKALAALK